MGDISELRGLIVTISFLSCTVLLLLWLPASDFAESIIEARQYSSPEDFDISQIMAYNSTYQITFNYTMDMPYHIDDSEVGHDLRLWLDKYWIALDHETSWWIFPSAHEMEWYDPTHTEKISDERAHEGRVIDALDIATLDNYEYGSNFFVECDHLQLKVGFSYNTITYSSHLEAFDSEALTMSLGVEWEIEKTTYNAWDLVSMLLTFSLPEVHVLINALLAIPIWTCIAYLCYVLIIKVIPLIAGG